MIGKIEALVSHVLTANPEVFTFSDIADGFIDVLDFQTTGVVAFAEGKPFTKLTTGRHDIGGRETQVNGDKLRECQEAIQGVVDQL